jgi:branched-subunit amino acid aminotransferase/4-amino-4-deoxychorismate lyase
MTKTVDPETIVYFDNQFVPLYEARVSILTHALHYGTGVFEGIRGYWDPEQLELSLFRLEDHFRRWKSNCGILRITVPPSVAELVDVTVALVRRNGFECNIYVRPLAYKAAQRIGVNPDDNDAFAVMAVPYGGYLDSLHGLHAGVVSWRRIQDAAIPSRGKICGAYVNSPGRRRSAAQRVRRSDPAQRKRPRRGRRLLQHLPGAERQAGHAAGFGEHFGGTHAGLRAGAGAPGAASGRSRAPSRSQ